MTLKSIEKFVIDAQLIKMLIFTSVYFSETLINSHIFRHIKLEIALAIPASNDKKIQLKQFSRTRVIIMLMLAQRRS